MSAQDHIDSFDTTVQKTYEWVNEVNRDLELDSRQRSYEVLRGFLHALRDRLPVDEAVHLGAQLPMLLRGIYYEGWNPTGKPEKMNLDEFLEHVRSKAVLVDSDDTEAMARSAARVLRQYVTEGEIRQVTGVLPADIRSLFEEKTAD